MIFCQFEPGVTYKSVTYKKACSLRGICENQESTSNRGIGSFKIILEKTSIPFLENFSEIFKSFVSEYLWLTASKKTLVIICEIILSALLTYDHRISTILKWLSFHIKRNFWHTFLTTSNHDVLKQNFPKLSHFDILRNWTNYISPNPYVYVVCPCYVEWLPPTAKKTASLWVF